MNVHVVSDSHGFHNQIKIPSNTDMIIHCGDASNSKDVSVNKYELLSFFEWYEGLDVKYKLFIPGNHDTAIDFSGFLKSFIPKGIDILIHQSIEIEGKLFFGSPYSPSYGEGWAFNRKRDKLHKYWEDIPNNTDVLITHSPPKGILDISEDRSRKMEYAGCSALLKAVMRIQPTLHCFGHVHDFQTHRNHGTRTIEDSSTTFINASLVEDGKFSRGLTHQGISFIL